MKPLNTPLTALALSLSILLTGCATTADYDAPKVAMSETFLYGEPSDQTTQSGMQSNWWQQFEDQTLNALVNDLQKQNIPLQVAAKRIEMASSYQSVVESFKVPTINVGGGYFNYQLSKNDSLLGPALNPIGDSVGSLPGSMGQTTLLDNQHDGGFVGASVMWEADLFGRIQHQANAAEIRVEQAEIYKQGLTTLITADLIHNYIQFRGAQERLALVESNLEDQEQTLDLVKKVVKSGYGSELDLMQANAMLAATKSLKPQLEIALQVHKQRIATLMNITLDDVNQRLDDAQVLPQMNGVIPVGLPSDLLQSRPDLRIAEREMAVINEELAASIANQYPKFFLTGAPTLSASSFDDLFSGDSFGWAASVGVSWNVFDGGRGEAIEQINESRFEAAALGYQHAVNSAIAEADSMLLVYGRSHENEAHIRDAIESSETAVKKAKSLYRAGLIDHLAVLDAQRQHRIMEDRLVAAKLQTAQVTVGVYKALGGDWSAIQ